LAPVGEVVAGSFRDPAGFVFRRDGVLYRQVNRSHASDYELARSSGLVGALVQSHLLIPHEEVDADPVAPEAHAILRPDEIGFISYPYEWSFSQLRDAALVTLEIQARAMERGMSLRDASAYNIQFQGGRPVLIDTLSFEERQNQPWVAYRQFCSHFLAPLALMSTRDARLGLLLREHIDGIPLDLTAKLLPRRSRIRPALALHIVAHARSQQKHGGAGDAGRRNHGLSDRAFRGILDSLKSGIERLPLPQGNSVWRDYYDQATHYTDDAAASKEAIVRSHIRDVAPASVWDLGANTGRFSRLASERGIDTVAFDMDPFAVEANYLAAREAGDQHLLPLVLDLTNPSPAVGWGNTERSTLTDRGPADLLLALALIHHLAIGNNVPLHKIAEYLASLGRHLSIEFIPKEDERVRQLLSSREDIFPAYSLEGFEGAMASHFTILRRDHVVGSSRVLYLLRRR
jgi:SAM-dependent methyltransferase